MKKRVFVTGANGMLGASVVRTLIQDGCEVHALIYPGSNTSVIEGVNMRVSEGDLCADLPLDEWLKDCDYIIHLAASTSIWPRRNKHVWAVNYDATLKLVEAATKAGIKRFVHIGTANSFDAGTQSNPGVEKGSYRAAKYGFDYMDSKHAIQTELLRKFKEEAFPVVVVNPTFMLGPYDSGPSSGKLILNALEGNVPGYSEGGRNFVYSKDVARAVVNAIDLGRPGECYLAAGENLTYKQFFTLVFERLGQKRKLRKVPHFLTLIGGGALSIWSRSTGVPPRLSFTMARMSKAGSYFSNGKALAELQMPETPISQAIDECATWLRNNGYVKLGSGFAGKTIVITGSTQGVGKTLAHAFLSKGANVVLNGRSAAKAEHLKHEFSFARNRAVYAPADVSTEEGAQQLIETTLQTFGRIDVLINNAGMSSYGDLEDSAPKVIREVLDSNATGSLLVTHFALPHLRRTKGSVLFISSLAGLHGLGGHSIYSAAKMSMIGLAQSLRKEMQRHGVFVGYTCLGFTENDGVKRTLAPDGTLEPVPSRPGIRPATQQYAVNKIMKQLQRKKFRSVHTFPGRLLFIVTRISEGVTMFAMKKGYDAERKFLEKLNRKRRETESISIAKKEAKPSGSFQEAQLK
ncbi:MAG: SDR family NAD(P)-dependent oxidoreductase [Flavobacteriales bacterium]|nr:SDR family NAD(P)-dependent oxidoreductase [Flavobacteriales bacterium]